MICNMDDEETTVMRGIWIPLGLPYVGKNGAPLPCMCEFMFRKMVSHSTQTEFADEAQANPRTWANAVSQTTDIPWASPIGPPKGMLRKSPFDLAEDIARASLCCRGREEMGTLQDCHVALKKGIPQVSSIGMEGSIARTHLDGMDDEQGYIENVTLDNRSQEEGFVALLKEFGDISEGMELIDQQQNYKRQRPPVKRGSLLEAEPKTGLDKEQMTPADGSSHQEAGNIITLKMWTISSVGATTVLEGIRTDINVMWHSSVIVQRLSARQLKTKSGAIYILKGPPNFPNRESSVFPSAVYRKFADGFPDDWDKVLTRHLAIHKTETRGAQPSERGEPAKDKARQTEIASLTKRRLPKEPCTRSGRHVRPPLDYWRGEHLITDPKTGKVHVMAGGHDYLLSHSIITPTRKHLCEMGKPAGDVTDKSLERLKQRSMKALARQVSDHDGTTKGSHKHQQIVPKPTARRLTEVKLALDALLQDLSPANQTESRTEQTESRTEQMESRTEQTESRTEQTESHTEQTESHTEQTESRTEQTESHTEQTESRTEQTESRTEQTESRTEQTERGSLGGSGPTRGEVAQMDHNSVKRVPYVYLKKILPDTLSAIQSLPSPSDAQTLEPPQPRENQVALQHSSRKRTLTFQDPTELLTELQECTEAIDEEESASKGIVRKAKRFRRTTSGPTMSTADTPTKEVGAQSERQRVESEGHRPSGPASEKPCQKPRNHEATGNEEDLEWPQSSSSSSECLSRSKRLRTRSERQALHLSAAKRRSLEAVTKAARYRNLQVSKPTKIVGVKPGMGSIGGNGAACAWRSLQLPLSSADLPVNTAADFIFSAITESEYNLHLRYAEGDHDLSD